MILRPTSVLPVNAICSSCQSTGIGTPHRTYLLNIRVLSERLPDGATISVNEVERARRETSLVDELRHVQRRERRELRRLEDDRAASRECRADLPRHHLHCTQTYSKVSTTRGRRTREKQKKRDARGKFQGMI